MKLDNEPGLWASLTANSAAPAASSWVRSPTSVRSLDDCFPVTAPGRRAPPARSLCEDRARRRRQIRTLGFAHERAPAPRLTPPAIRPATILESAAPAVGQKGARALPCGVGAALDRTLALRPGTRFDALNDGADPCRYLGPQRPRQIVPHPVEDDELGLRDRIGGRPATAHVDKRIIGTVEHERRHAYQT